LNSADPLRAGRESRGSAGTAPGSYNRAIRQYGILKKFTHP